MSRQQNKALASSHLVALAERASESGAKHGVLVALDGGGNVYLYPTEDTPPLLLAGMLVFALSMLTDDATSDDDEDE